MAFSFSLSDSDSDSDDDQENANKLVYFMTIEEARFRKPVVPGDVLELAVTKLKARRNVWKFRGEARVNGATVSEAVFTAMIVDE